MTSRGDNLETNEFLRLRKLRLQQVREQSKDIAKKIRQRAKAEQLRQVTNVDANKEKVYLQRQEQLVKRLEQLYSKGLENVGAGHKNASELNKKCKTDNSVKRDLSKLRGKEAVADLRKKKQEKLDEQKQLLDRKLQAREAANERSREKSVIVNNILTKTSSSKNLNEASAKATDANEKISNTEANGEQNKKDKSDAVTKNDMGTQWDFEEIPNEWEPNIPSLSIPQDDSVKNFASDNAEKIQKSKRLNLFALSDEMPSSLRGGITSMTDDRGPLKPSLTAVSEYLQNRGLRLREPEIVPQKKSTDDLQSIKQTLLKTRASRTDGRVPSSICHVLDEQVLPVPCWQAQNNCKFCQFKHRFPQYCKNKSNEFSLNKSSTYQPVLEDLSLSFNTLKPCTWSHKCHNRHRIPVSGSNHKEHSVKSGDINSALSKKNSVTMYDHNTRDKRDLPHDVENIVVRDQSNEEDAYCQALKAASVDENGDKSYHKAQQEARNRIAMTKQNVDKEYRDTLAFLNSLPKYRNTKPIRTAFMDGDRQQEMKERRQQRLQQEYKKAQKECSKQHNKHTKHKATGDHRNNNSKSPLRMDIDNNLISRDFQYSWLPVPESDGSLAIHTVSSNAKEKSGNSVKFSSVDTYHEYRSRHKHTPPTKDEPQKKIVMIQENSNDSINSSYDTDTSSVENLQVKQDDLRRHRVDKDNELADAERIIIYKVMESNKDKKHKMHKTKKTKRYNETQNVNDMEKTSASHLKAQNISNKDVTDEIHTNTLAFTQLKEGVYKSVRENGLCSNVLRCFTNVDLWHTSTDRKPWWDNISSMYFSDDQPASGCNEHNLPHDKDTGAMNEIGDNSLKRTTGPTSNCKCKSIPVQQQSDKHPSATTSTSSFKTAFNDKNTNISRESGYIKFVDEGGQDAGKFYVGASGFLKDDAYEVVIQLRKKEVEKSKILLQDPVQCITPSAKNIEANENVQESTADKSTNVKKSSKTANVEIQQNSPVKDQSVLESPTEINTSITHPEKHIQNEDDKLFVQTVKNNSKQNISIVERPNVSDKAACTSFQDTFAIPDNVPKSDVIQRPAISTYTQTTQSSPITRPVLMHLSSSTSTTYMSPPESVLPRYFRNAAAETYGDAYDQVSCNFNSKEGCKRCGCHKCNEHKRVATDTPPNSTRSADQADDNFSNKDNNACCRNSHPNNDKSHKKIKDHNCRKHFQYKICSKQKFKRSNIDLKRNQNGSNVSTLRSKKSKMAKNPGNSNLNPLIENYVKKLLALNKDGLMAIEVVNQECSGVNTPGSSIIEVPSNINNVKSMVNNKISLEQIKNSLKEQILKNIEERKLTLKRNVKTTGSQTDRNIKTFVKSNRKRPIHKVKSLNISKQFTKTQIYKENKRQSAQSTIITASPVSLYSRKGKSSQVDSSIEVSDCRIKIPICRSMSAHPDYSNNTSNSDANYFIRPRQRVHKVKTSHSSCKINTVPRNNSPNKSGKHSKLESCSLPTRRTTTTSQSSESEISYAIRNQRKLATPPISTSTQTKQVDSEVEFMKLAENKLQNMEKIADLTEKCTKRLSNLAKVLEEVRKNKSLAYSQISTSDSTSDTDQRSDKLLPANDNRIHAFNPAVEIQTLTKALSSLPTSPNEEKQENIKNPTYGPILVDIPKPDSFKSPSPLSCLTENDNSNTVSFLQKPFFKNRARPPPALTRVHLKNASDDFVCPHELSTVVEVDSPMSVKLKNNSTNRDSKDDSQRNIAESNNVANRNSINGELINKNLPADPRLISKLDISKESADPRFISKVDISKEKYKTKSGDSSDDSKMKMMDLKQFNEIMLKPFISLQDYAKQHNLVETDDGSINIKMSKEEHVNEELSSLHSDASIPDVMAELLKRNLISEPFKFETTSATVSSESTLSMLALSRVGKNRKKSDTLLNNKENIAETSEYLSISSNPDLEHAFQRLGMGWASSTLKKTKERLALSSSSNTSSSSIPQFKIKSFHYQDVPEISKDSIISLLNISNKDELTIAPQSGNVCETAKNALQQTSIPNSMTVKEFLANELAKKITFSNKSNRNTTEDEFISLCETKMPDEIKLLSHKSAENEKSVDSGVQSNAGGSNNRARTSTPVHIFKSMAYHSTSSSNTSNGLFSNADDLSSVKVTSNSNKNHSTSDKDDLTIPNYSLKMRKGLSDCSKSD